MVGYRWGGPDFGGARLSKDRIGLARVPVHNLPIVGDVCERAEPWPWRTTARRAFWRSYVFQRRNTDLLREIPGSFGSLAPPILLTLQTTTCTRRRLRRLQPGRPTGRRKSRAGCA